MAYIEGGTIKTKRSMLRLSIVSDLFRNIWNFIVTFIITMFSMEASDSYGKKRSSEKRSSGFGGGGGGGGGGSGGGPYGGGGPRGLSNIRGIDHSAPPPCGSCCGG